MKKLTKALNLLEKIDNNVMGSYDYIFNLKNEEDQSLGQLLGLSQSRIWLKEAIKEISELQTLIKDIQTNSKEELN